MPELPECERTRGIIERAAVGKTIVSARCARDSIVFTEGSVRTRRALEGRKVIAARRRGKQLWCELDARPWPLFHLGMTGSFRTPETEVLRLAASPKNEPVQWPPRFTKLHLTFDDGSELVMTNARRLGRISLRHDPETEAPIDKLGFDVMLDPPGRADFCQQLSRRTGLIKAVLLNQSFAAGVGNWIADEVLYQAKIDPRRRANELTRNEASRIYSRLLSVVRHAVSVNADKTRFPRTWLFHRRWGKAAGAKTKSGKPIEFVTIAGRTTAWVPGVQE